MFWNVWCNFAASMAIVNCRNEETRAIKYFPWFQGTIWTPNNLGWFPGHYFLFTPVPQKANKRPLTRLVGVWRWRITCFLYSFSSNTSTTARCIWQLSGLFSFSSELRQFQWYTCFLIEVNMEFLIVWMHCYKALKGMYFDRSSGVKGILSTFSKPFISLTLAGVRSMLCFSCLKRLFVLYFFRLNYARILPFHVYETCLQWMHPFSLRLQVLNLSIT